MELAAVNRALALSCVVAGVAAAQEPDARDRQLELLRTEVANELQLQAAGLLDELVYGWLQSAPFETDTAVVLAGVSVPVSLGTGLEAFLENHLAGLVLKNPRTHVQLVHCPSCSAWVVHSGAAATVVTRGFESPEVLSQVSQSSGAKQALFLDFEAEGSALMLRARLTSLERSLRISWARTLSTATSTAPMLRESDRLTSVAQARKEYLDALGGRGLVLVPVRVAVRTYAEGTSSSFAPTPFPWVGVGLEASFSQARAWTASINAAFSWLPNSHVALLAQGRIARLVTGNSTSLTWPDVYAFAGAGVLFGQGSAMLLFRNEVPTIDDVRNVTTNNEPRSTLGMITVGLEVRVKNRIGLSVYAETYPGLTNTDNIGFALDLGFVRFQSLGIEVSFCF